MGGFTISIACKYDLYGVVLQLGGHLILRLAVLVVGEHLVILRSAGCNWSIVSASNIPEPLLGESSLNEQSGARVPQRVAVATLRLATQALWHAEYTPRILGFRASFGSSARSPANRRLAFCRADLLDPRQALRHCCIIHPSSRTYHALVELLTCRLLIMSHQLGHGLPWNLKLFLILVLMLSFFDRLLQMTSMLGGRS